MEKQTNPPANADYVTRYDLALQIYHIINKRIEGYAMDVDAQNYRQEKNRIKITYPWSSKTF